MLKIEKLRSEDFPQAVELANTMNWNMTTADFDFNKNLEPNGCFALKETSKLIGIATCISYGKVGWFGNLIVEEKQRNQGAGTSLVKYASNFLKNKGVTTVGLYAYTHLTNFYSKIGFKQDQEFVVLKAQIAQLKSRLKKNELKRLRQIDIPNIIELDAKCFGASRRKLLEPILKDKETTCFVNRNEGRISGFIVVNSYEGITEIGPLSCDNMQINVAKELLSAAICSQNDSEAYMCLPVSEKVLIDMASEYGFKEKFKVTRMFLGPPIKTDCIYMAESLERG